MEAIEMDENILIAKLSSLLENEKPLVGELILETVNDVEARNLSTEAHGKRIERFLDQKLNELGGEEKQ